LIDKAKEEKVKEFEENVYNYKIVYIYFTVSKD